MDVILAIILVFAGALLPQNKSEFSVELHSNKIVLVKQEDNTWLSEEVSSKGGKGNSTGQFKIEGLNIGVGIPGQEIKTTNISRILGVETAEELKSLNEVSVGNKQIKISKSDNGFTLLLAKKEIAKIYW